MGGILVAETAIDADPRTPEYEHLLPVRPDESRILYALVAVDRAGNPSAPTWLRVQGYLSAADDGVLIGYMRLEEQPDANEWGHCDSIHGTRIEQMLVSAAGDIQRTNLTEVWPMGSSAEPFASCVLNATRSWMLFPDYDTRWPGHRGTVEQPENNFILAADHPDLVVPLGLPDDRRALSHMVALSDGSHLIRAAQM